MEIVTGTVLIAPGYMTAGTPETATRASYRTLKSAEKGMSSKSVEPVATSSKVAPARSRVLTVTFKVKVIGEAGALL